LQKYMSSDASADGFPHLAEKVRAFIEQIDILREKSNYMSLHEGRSENNLVKDIELSNYSLGMGALGLPGDFSSASRFIKATFVKYNSISGETEKESVNQFFHILDSVAMPKGCVLTDNGEYEYTIYSSCCNADKGVYYYKNYNSFEIKSVNFNSHNLQDKKLLEFKIKYC